MTFRADEARADTVPSPRDATRSDSVYRTLRGWVIEGKVPFEGRLPTENELATHFQVSRPIVRRAIARLRDDGLVRSIQGSGTMVIYERGETASVASSDMAQGSVRELQRCFEFRLLIESEAAYLAALRHNPSSLKRISECVYPSGHEFWKTAPRPGETLNFHGAVVKAADNVFLERAMDLVMSQPGFQVYLRLRSAKRADDGDDRSSVNQEHLEILRLIERRLADDAREYMRYHIQSAYDYVINRIPVGDQA
jgi:GntR family transcriptional regulator, transcriptional repressor for pyruvate dehydrogenase complex